MGGILRFNLIRSGMRRCGLVSFTRADLMKFDPRTKELFTDAGQFLKRLHCPLRVKWSNLESMPSSSHRVCSECERQVLNTAEMSDAQILSAIQSDPDTCVAISARQENVSIIQWNRDSTVRE